MPSASVYWRTAAVLFISSFVSNSKKFKATSVTVVASVLSMLFCLVFWSDVFKFFEAKTYELNTAAPIAPQEEWRNNHDHIKCKQPYSCSHKVELRRYSLLCLGESSCINITNSHLNSMHCNGTISCVHIEKTIVEQNLVCGGAFSCANASIIVYLNSQITADGTFALAHSIITVENIRNLNKIVNDNDETIMFDNGEEVKIFLSGYLSGYNLTIYADTMNQKITIDCLENACVNTTIVTSSSLFNTFGVLANTLDCITCFVNHLVLGMLPSKSLTRESDIGVNCHSSVDCTFGSTHNNRGLMINSDKTGNDKIQSRYIYLQSKLIEMTNGCQHSDDFYDLFHKFGMYNVYKFDILTSTVQVDTASQHYQYKLYNDICARSYNAVQNNTIHVNSIAIKRTESSVLIVKHKNMVCGGARSCQSHFLDNIMNVYDYNYNDNYQYDQLQSALCLGAGSCSAITTKSHSSSDFNLKFENIENVYCAGSHTCKGIEILNPINVYFFSNRNDGKMNNNLPAIINVANNSYYGSTSIWFKSSGSGSNVKIICAAGTVCEIHCDTLPSCSQQMTFVQCDGLCRLYCHVQYDNYYDYKYNYDSTYNYTYQYFYCPSIINKNNTLTNIKNIKNVIIYPVYLNSDETHPCHNTRIPVNTNHGYTEFNRGFSMILVVIFAALKKIIEYLWKTYQSEMYSPKKKYHIVVSDIFSVFVLPAVFFEVISPLSVTNKMYCIMVPVYSIGWFRKRDFLTDNNMYQVQSETAHAFAERINDSTLFLSQQNVIESARYIYIHQCILNMNQHLDPSPALQRQCKMYKKWLTQVCGNKKCSKPKYLFFRDKKRSKMKVVRINFTDAKVVERWCIVAEDVKNMIGMSMITNMSAHDVVDVEEKQRQQQ